ncbi:thiopurine S-methyltransferase [Nonlabens dokdonensis]|jgi:thiopurine S-methyltransferase|uniref:Thiopurine methyltransferase n=2 Tax=Nonlabens dokdonensis TaxID=328515 RepID=L7WF52_NONDD|nr:thiopurine methyltransferase [Nonlabens dokdonensis]AGC77528.1 thiopurine methyltransferase [Nonlabens dokdonensis DSW-6]PZX39917.1 thiopurine S-methyltransferase [Nonlabens dokdonensis]
MILDKKYWQDRYVNDSTGWDLGHVSSPMKRIIDSIENKELSILIPGAGNAHEAQYLIEKGFTDITVLDIAREPLDELAHRISNDSSVKIVNEDFFNHEGFYDLILEQTFFCALDPSLREKYVVKANELLNDYGCLEGVLFDFKDNRETPPFSGSLDEYIDLFQEKFDILKLERCLFSESSRKNKELVIKIKKNGK